MKREEKNRRENDGSSKRSRDEKANEPEADLKIKLSYFIEDAVTKPELNNVRHWRSENRNLFVPTVSEFHPSQPWHSRPSLLTNDADQRCRIDG